MLGQALLWIVDLMTRNATMAKIPTPESPRWGTSPTLWSRDHSLKVVG